MWHPQYHSILQVPSSQSMVLDNIAIVPILAIFTTCCETRAVGNKMPVELLWQNHSKLQVFQLTNANVTTASRPWDKNYF